MSGKADLDKVAAEKHELEVVRLKLIWSLLFIPMLLGFILLAIDFEIKKVVIALISYSMLSVFNIMFDVYVPTRRREVEMLDSSLRVVDDGHEVANIKWSEIQNYQYETSSLYLSFIIYYGNKKKLRFAVLDKEVNRLPWLDCMERIEQVINEKGNPDKTTHKYRGWIAAGLVLAICLIVLWLFLNGHLGDRRIIGPLLVFVGLVMSQIANLYRRR